MFKKEQPWGYTASMTSFFSTQNCLRLIQNTAVSHGVKELQVSSVHFCPTGWMGPSQARCIRLTRAWEKSDQLRSALIIYTAVSNNECKPDRIGSSPAGRGGGVVPYMGGCAACGALPLLGNWQNRGSRVQMAADWCCDWDGYATACLIGGESGWGPYRQLPATLMPEQQHKHGAGGSAQHCRGRSPWEQVCGQAWQDKNWNRDVAEHSALAQAAWRLGSHPSGCPLGCDAGWRVHGPCWARRSGWVTPRGLFYLRHPAVLFCYRSIGHSRLEGPMRIVESRSGLHTGPPQSKSWQVTAKSYLYHR